MSALPIITLELRKLAISKALEASPISTVPSEFGFAAATDKTSFTIAGFTFIYPDGFITGLTVYCASAKTFTAVGFSKSKAPSGPLSAKIPEYPVRKNPESSTWRITKSGLSAELAVLPFRTRLLFLSK